MRGFFLIVSLIVSGLGMAQGEAPPVVPAQQPKAPTTFIAAGEAVEIPDAGFTIIPPIGWEVQRNAAGASLFFQAPKIEGAPGVVTYQPNIRVMVMSEPRPIDDATKEEFAKVIADKNGNLGGVSNYSIRSAEKVTFSSGVMGFLYYTEFSLAGTPMMQMHVLVSSGTKHFLMTYVDLATAFEAENSPGLATAYTSMQGVKLDTKPIERFAEYYGIGGGIFALIVLLVLIRVVRANNMKRLGERIESEDSHETSSVRDDDDDVSNTALLSNVEQGEDDELPETREARSPPPKQTRGHVPAPKLAKAMAPPRPAAPTPAGPPAQLPIGVPTVPVVKTPIAETHRDEDPVSSVHSETWNLASQSNVSEIKPTAVVTMTKAKHQKVLNPAKLDELKPNLDDEGSEVARLSEILPNTGDTKKKKGFFGWGKSKDSDDDLSPSIAAGRIGDEDSWDEESKKVAQSTRSRDSDKKPKGDKDPPVSDVADWNLKSDSNSSRRDDDEGDD